MVREIGDNELTALLRLYTQLHDNQMPEQTEAILRVWAQIRDDENHRIIVAEEDGRLVSSCVLVIIPNLTHGQRPYALIENVITDEAYRRRGLASACLDFARNTATAANCYKIMLMTGSKQEATHRFYEQAGYNSSDKTAYIQWLKPGVRPERF